MSVPDGMPCGTPCWVGFDTSNYTTSIAVAAYASDKADMSDLGGKRLTVAANLKTPLPVPPGGRGLRQSEAVFAHVKNLPGLIASLQEVLEAGHYRVAAVGCSSKPRDAKDSYMPCFLEGIVAARAFAAGCGVPTYTFSHQSGHIMAALYSSGMATRVAWTTSDTPQTERMPTNPFLAFHVSGGTTEAVLSHPRIDGFSVELVGGGADLHAGQVIDRVGVMMGLSFPCGPAMEALAVTYKGELPPIKLSVRNGVCNLSGLENQAAALWQKTSDAPLVSAYVLTFIGRTLRCMTDQIQERLSCAGNPSPYPVVYAGGVMSNRFIRPLLESGAKWQVFFAEPAFSADNAAGIALLCAYKDRTEQCGKISTSPVTTM